MFDMSVLSCSGETLRVNDLWVACPASCPHETPLLHSLLHSLEGASPAPTSHTFISGRSSSPWLDSLQLRTEVPLRNFDVTGRLGA